jgi:NADH-quinone oxidoreductase subunit J
MAALFVFAGAEFLAVTQIIVYVGGILILVLFGVMLTQKLRDESPKTQILHVIPGLLASIGLFIAILFLIQSFPQGEPQWANSVKMQSAEPNLATIGKGTVTLFLLPFEAISILLLAALIGAASLSRKVTPKKETL